MRRLMGWVATVGAALLLATAGWAAFGPEGVSDRAALDDPDSTSGTSTSSARLAPTTTTSPPTTSQEAAPGGASSVGLDLGEVRIVSGRVADVGIPPTRRPVRIELADLGISASIQPVGYDPDRAEMEIPRTADEVGWYTFGAAPGESGSAVLAAHVDWNGRRGVFFDLYRAEIGSRVLIEFDDGSSSAFEVFAAGQYDKQALPTDEIFTRAGEPVLTLITCGGVFNEAVRSYEDNVVVYARPVR